MVIKQTLNSRYASSILIMAGYAREKNGSYIKDIGGLKRFHVYVFDNHIELHADDTINGYHKLSKEKKPLIIELNHILSFKRNAILNIEGSSKIKPKPKYKSKTAPNLLVLQIKASQLNSNHGACLSKRLINFLKKIYGKPL